MGWMIKLKGDLNPNEYVIVCINKETKEAELEELGKKMGIVDYIYFSKFDGSCPDCIYIRLTQDRYE